MKILLVGEYSRLHNSLKEGLVALGHEVLLIGSGDHFKQFPVDFKLEKRFNKGFGKFLKLALYRVSGIDISGIDIKNQFFKNAHKFKGFDVVQLINESSFAASANSEKKIASYLKKHNKKLFLLSCGNDYASVRYAYDKKFRYSILDPYFNGKVSEKEFWHITKYLKPSYKKLHDYLYSIVNGVIASDLDYHIPLQGNKKYLGMIANPINIDKIEFIENRVEDKIIIFHGINRNNYYKKGNDIFEAALKIIIEKYGDKVEVLTVENLPYSEYIKIYNRAHILLDQVLCYDQGYNALEAMAKGKVVFTGAEQEFLDYYKLEKTVVINAVPKSEKIAEDLEKLIVNPEKITEIGKNAREFVESEHNYKKVAGKYLEIWKTS